MCVLVRHLMSQYQGGIAVRPEKVVIGAASNSKFEIGKKQ